MFVFVATYNLRRILRRARRMQSGSPGPKDVEMLLEDVFRERRVLRSTVGLHPDYPGVARAVQAIGRNVAAKSDDPQRTSTAAVMQICGGRVQDNINLNARDPIRLALLQKDRQTLRLEALSACDLLETRRPLRIEARPGHIAHVAAMTLPYKTNGYSSQTQGIALGYQSNGLTIDAMSKAGFSLNYSRWMPKSSIPAREEINGVTCRRILEPLVNDRIYTLYAEQAPDAIEAELRKVRPEHVIAASNYSNGIPALITAQRLGLPFTHEVRAMRELTRASDHLGFENTRLFFVMQQLANFVCSNADRVLTLATPMLDNPVSRGLDRSKIAFMPNGISPEMLETVDRDLALAKALGLPPKRVVVGYAGAFKEYEGLQDLATAMALVAEKGLDVALLVLGEEKPDALGRMPITTGIREAFEQVGHSDRLIMTGRVPFEDMKENYSLMDICPITRRGYAVSEMVSPIKPVEAMAQKKAVVLSEVEAMRYFAQNGTTALTFRPGDVRQLVERIGALVTDESLRAELSQRGRRFVESQLQWTRICADATAHIGLTPAQEPA